MKLAIILQYIPFGSKTRLLATEIQSLGMIVGNKLGKNRFVKEMRKCKGRHSQLSMSYFHLNLTERGSSDQNADFNDAYADFEVSTSTSPSIQYP